jgi:hypothetical protein
MELVTGQTLFPQLRMYLRQQVGHQPANQVDAVDESELF